jgi:plastocyanin
MLAERTFGSTESPATATLLQTGNVLVSGGDTSAGTTLQSAEEYLPTLNTWVPAPALRTPRDTHTATLLTDGRVLIAGGGAFLATSELYPAPAPISASNYLFDPATQTSKQAQGVRWSVVQGTHTVVDSANLGVKSGLPTPLFASGTLTAGKSFTYTFFAAGTYSYRSTAGEPTPMAGAVAVPLKLARTQDGTGRLQLTWADTLLPHQAENVQERFEPLGSTTFGAWTDIRTPAGTLNWTYLDGFFSPTAVGTYQFHARLRNTVTGHISGFSPPVAVTLRSLP